MNSKDLSSMGQSRLAKWGGFYSLTVGLVLCSAAALVAQAGMPEFDADVEARRVFTTIMSPYCPGQTLADCTSSAAVTLRDHIRAQLHQGRPSQEIMDELVEVFGPQVLALPPNRGIGQLAWLGPIFALLSGLLLIFHWSRQRQKPLPAKPQEQADDPELRRRLEEELEQFD